MTIPILLMLHRLLKILRANIEGHYTHGRCVNAKASRKRDAYDTPTGTRCQFNGIGAASRTRVAVTERESKGITCIDLVGSDKSGCEACERPTAAVDLLTVIAGFFHLEGECQEVSRRNGSINNSAEIHFHQRLAQACGINRRTY